MSFEKFIYIPKANTEAFHSLEFSFYFLFIYNNKYNEYILGWSVLGFDGPLNSNRTDPSLSSLIHSY